MKPKMTSEQADQRLKDVASLYEKQFLRELVKSMRTTVTESGLVKTNPAEKMYRENLDQDYVEKWGDKGGIGLSKIIYDQLLQKLGPQMGIKAAEGPAPKGPFPVHPDHPLKINTLPSENPKQKNLLIESPAGGPRAEVLAPWNSRVTFAQKINPTETLLRLQHDNGFKSQILGAFEDQEIKPDYLAGEKITNLKDGQNKIIWTVESTDTV